MVVGGISPTAPEGVGTAQFIGTLYRPYVSIYGYAETYEDEATNALKPMIAPKDVLIGCSKSPALTSYGSVTQVEQNGETASYSRFQVRSAKARDSERGSHRASDRIAAVLDPLRLGELGGDQAARRGALRESEQHEEREEAQGKGETGEK